MIQSIVSVENKDKPLVDLIVFLKNRKQRKHDYSHIEYENSRFIERDRSKLPKYGTESARNNKG